MEAPVITHHQEKENFTLEVGGAEATIKYHLSKNNTKDNSPAIVDFTSTYVPPEFRGKGLAESLVSAGLKWAKNEGYEITASCWYVQKFLR